MKAVVYYTEIPEKYVHKNMEHMAAEKLLAAGLYKEFGLKLAFEPRAKGEHGKPFLTLQPRIHYNISHSGKYVMCVIAGQEVGIDIQEHRKVNYERLVQKVTNRRRLFWPSGFFGRPISSGPVRDWQEISVLFLWTRAAILCWKWKKVTVELSGPVPHWN